MPVGGRVAHVNGPGAAARRSGRWPGAVIGGLEREGGLPIGAEQSGRGGVDLTLRCPGGRRSDHVQDALHSRVDVAEVVVGPKRGTRVDLHIPVDRRRTSTPEPRYCPGVDGRAAVEGAGRSAKGATRGSGESQAESRATRDLRQPGTLRRRVIGIGQKDGKRNDRGCERNGVELVRSRLEVNQVPGMNGDIAAKEVGVFENPMTDKRVLIRKVGVTHPDRHRRRTCHRTRRDRQPSDHESRRAQDTNRTLPTHFPSSYRFPAANVAAPYWRSPPNVISPTGLWTP